MSATSNERKAIQAKLDLLCSNDKYFKHYENLSNTKNTLSIQPKTIQHK